MRYTLKITLAILLAITCSPGAARADKKLKIVATIPTYGAIAEAIVGQRGQVTSLARGYEDPHFVRPKPSLARSSCWAGQTRPGVALSHECLFVAVEVVLSSQSEA